MGKAVSTHSLPRTHTEPEAIKDEVLSHNAAPEHEDPQAAVCGPLAYFQPCQPWLPLERENRGISEEEGAEGSFTTRPHPLLNTQWKWGPGLRELRPAQRRDHRCCSLDTDGMESNVLRNNAQAKPGVDSSFTLGGKQVS